MCIERMDHHCPWLGQCIGAHNYARFLVMIFFVTLATIPPLFWSLRIVLYPGFLFWLHPMAFVCAAVMLLIGVFTGFLFVAHSCMLCMGASIVRHISRAQFHPNTSKFVDAGITTRQFWLHAYNEPACCQQRVPGFLRCLALCCLPCCAATGNLLIDGQPRGRRSLWRSLFSQAEQAAPQDSGYDLAAKWDDAAQARYFKHLLLAQHACMPEGEMLAEIKKVKSN